MDNGRVTAPDGATTSPMLCPLHHLKEGATGIIRHIEGCGAERGKLLALGFVAGKPVEVLQNAQGPMVVRLGGSRICLCRRQARQVLVEIHTAAPQNRAEDSSRENTRPCYTQACPGAIHKFKNLWRSFSGKRRPCRCSPSAFASGGFTK